MDIFLLLGVPAILQGDNGTEFTAHVISEIKDFGLVLVMVHGKPRHPQILGSIERANVDVKYCRWPDLLIMARKTGLQTSCLCSSRRTLPIIQGQSALRIQFRLAKRLVWELQRFL